MIDNIGLQLTPSDVEALSLRQKSHEALGRKREALADAETLRRLLSDGKEEEPLEMRKISAAIREEENPNRSKFYLC